LRAALTGRPDRPPESLASAILDGWAALRGPDANGSVRLGIYVIAPARWWVWREAEWGGLRGLGAGPSVPWEDWHHLTEVPRAWRDFAPDQRAALLAAWEPVWAWHQAGRPQGQAPWDEP